MVGSDSEHEFPRCDGHVGRILRNNRCKKTDMKSKSKDVTLAAIYALGEGRCQAENITRELHRLSQSDDMEIKIAAIKALGRIYR